MTYSIRPLQRDQYGALPLICNHPILERGKRYKLRGGKIIEIEGIVSMPAPKDTMALEPAWEHSYWVVGWGNKAVPEKTMLELLESTKPVRGGRSASKPKKFGGKARKARK